MLNWLGQIKFVILPFVIQLQVIIKRNLSEKISNHFTAVTIGTFDGVHVGHRKIIDKLINTARLNGLKSTILTFFPHPRMVLQQDTGLKLINTLDEKIEILKSYGLDQLVVHPFTKEFSRLSASDYVKEVLVESLHAKKIIIGYDHRFGRNRSASIADLVEYGKTFHFEVEEISAEEINDVSVSSTKIRKALESGDMQTANLYLGYEFMLTGTVTKGKGLGRQIKFPTANLHIEETYKLIPQNGVYVVKSAFKGNTVFGMMNIGFNPTVNGTSKTIEIHFFEFEENLYGKKMQVRLLTRLRDEKKFNSLEDLKAQLVKDKESATNFIQKKYAE